MKRTLMAFILFSQIAAASGPDEMILGPKRLPGMGTEDYIPGEACSTGFRAQFLHSSLYPSGDYSGIWWSYVGVKFGTGKWGGFGRFRSYGFESLYHDNYFMLGGAFSTGRGIAISLSAKYEREEFGSDAYGRLDLGLASSYTRGLTTLVGYLERLNLKKPYDFDGITRPDFGLSGSYAFKNGITLGAGYENPSLGPGRLILGQRAKLADLLGLRLGYMNNPDLLIWGLDLSVKKLTLEFTFIAIGRLNDTTVLGLSYGAR